MPHAPTLGLGRKGLHAPCIFWPSTYVPQEFECIAASPDGSVLAASCSSGQVYIWHCSYSLRGECLRLDPLAISLGGWLGPAKILGIDFCQMEEASAELAGLASGLLLVCILPGGQLRVLDTTDGRCVANISARPGSAHRNIIGQVLGDGRHLVLGGCSNELIVIDLWPGRAIAKLLIPSSDTLLRLATSKRSQPPSVCNVSSCIVSAASSDTVFAWHWGGGSSEDNVKSFFTFNFVRGVGRHKGELIGLSLEDGVLLLGLTECLLLWRLRKDGAGPCVQVHFPSGVTTRALVGSCLLPVNDYDGPNMGNLNLAQAQARSKHCGSRRRRSASVSGSDLLAKQCLSRDPEIAKGRLQVLAWTATGNVFRCDASDDILESRNLVVEASTTLPKASRYAYSFFFNFGPSLVGCVPSELGDSLYFRFFRTNVLKDSGTQMKRSWMQAVSLEELWQSSASRYGVSVKCAAVVENHQCTWLMLGLSGRPGKVCALAISSDGVCQQRSKSTFEDTQLLSVSPGFDEPTCLLPLGASYLAVGDSRGMVCGWSLADWRLITIPPPAYRVAIVSLAQVWSPRPDVVAESAEPLVSEVGMVAALNELGRCRVINLRAGEVLCCLQSQINPESWFDEPLRITYDRASRYLFTASPGLTSVWDAASGAFMGNSTVGGSESVDSGAVSREPEKCGEGSTLGFRCPTLRNPSFGIDAVSWQVPSVVNGDMSMPMWRFGEVLLDGPFWRLPVMLFSPSQLVPKLIGGSSTRFTPSSSSTATAAAPSAEVTTQSSSASTKPAQEGEITSVGTATVCSDPLASVLSMECSAQFVSDLEARLRSLGVRLAGPLCVVGVLGVDDSISFPLPRRCGPTQRSVSPVRGRAKGTRRNTRSGDASAMLNAQEISPVYVCTAFMSQELLQGSLLDCEAVPHVAFAVMMRLLLHSEVAAAPQVFQRWILPRLQKTLHNVSLPCLMRLLDGWTKILNREAPSSRSTTVASSGGSNSGTSPLSTTDAVLRHCGFGSAAFLNDAATVMLALVAHLEPKLFNRFCPPRTAALVTEGLCLRMFTRIGGMQLQSISCEVLALGFPTWRKHLATALPKRPSAYARSTASGTTMVSGSSSSGKTAPPTDRVSEAASSPTPEVGSGLPDEDLEWLTVQVLALYQEPRVAPSCLAVMMQVGAADSGTLLHVMGKAARRLDLGSSYASSALLVLVSFVHRSPSKVIALLPRFTEAVLRCLEPSDPALRRQSLLAVTSALHELVQTYPMVSFHQPSQKFAVGTGDGLVVVYDLRTATKWRILEGHTGPISAIAFSRDGNQLSSYSVQDSTIRLWQCSSNGFLGGLLGSSGRCLKQHGLPPCMPFTPSPDTWRSINLSWTERGHLRLVRESSETIHLKPD